MNKMFYKISVFIFFLNLSAIEVIADEVIPLGITPYSFLYEQIEKYETSSQDNYFYSVAPYRLDIKKVGFTPLPYLQFNSKDKINLFFIGSESLNSQTYNSPIIYEAFRAGFSGKFNNNIFVYSNIILDEQKAKDSSYLGKKWRGYAGGIEQSFLNISSKNYNILIGRFKTFWGIRKSLVLSESNALDGFGYSLKYKKLMLTYRFAKLNQLRSDSSIDLFNNRYFAGHRLDIKLHKKLRIGIFESIIFGGVGRSAEFNYLNPLMSYHVEQLNHDVNDNSFLGFDFTVYPFKNSKLYGQIFIDDYQIENETQGDQEPNQYGLVLGAYLVDVLKGYDLRCEYIKISNRTYNQMKERNRYTLDNNSIGYFNANNFDRINLSCTKWISPQSSFALKFRFDRKGENTIQDSWSTPWNNELGNYSEPFPFGIVEKTNSISGQFKGFLFKNFYLDTEAGIEKITNRSNIVQNSQQNGYVSVKLFTFFSQQI